MNSQIRLNSNQTLIHKRKVKTEKIKAKMKHKSIKKQARNHNLMSNLTKKINNNLQVVMNKKRAKKLKK